MQITSNMPANTTTSTAAASARAADGDYKTKGIGHEVTDADGDYKPQQVSVGTSGAKSSSSAVLQALSTLQKGG